MVIATGRILFKLTEDELVLIETSKSQLMFFGKRNFLLSRIHYQTMTLNQVLGPIVTNDILLSSLLKKSNSKCF